MDLYHYADEAFELDFSKKYTTQDARGFYKPSGLWVSDESEFGWREWCEGERYCLDGLQVRYRVELNTENIRYFHCRRFGGV